MSFRGILAGPQNDGLLKEAGDPISPMLEATDRARGKGPIFFDNAASLRRSPVELMRLENGVLVPHEGIGLKGYITGEQAREGPFVNITDTRDLVREEPVIRLTRMMTREDPIYHGLLQAGGEHKRFLQQVA